MKTVKTIAWIHVVISTLVALGAVGEPGFSEVATGIAMFNILPIVTLVKLKGEEESCCS